MTSLMWNPVKIKLGQIKPWADNPRMSTKAQAERLIKSERELGQIQTLAVSPFGEDGKVDLYDGHQRYSAWLTVKGADYEVVALQSNRPLSEDERRKVAVLLHMATGSWNWDALASWQVGELKDWGMDKDALKGWNSDATNLKELLNSEQAVTADAEPQIDRAAELLEKWQVKTGDLWQIGDHRLLCGDSTKREDVERVMGGERAELAPVDPPYNVGFDYDGETVDDTKSAEIYEKFSRAWFGECQRVSDRQIVTPGCNNLASWLRWFDAYHWAPWTKSNSLTNGKVSRFWCWEPVLFFGEKWKRARSNDIFDFPIGMQKDTANHPCPKPIKMWIDLLENYSESGAIIYESFGGSGTTFAASEQTGRKCRAIEISPAYCAVILERMSTAFPGIEIKRLE